MIASKTKNHFVNRSREIIIKRIIEELQSQKKGENAGKYLQNKGELKDYEFALANLNDLNNLGSLETKIGNNLKKEEVDSVAEGLALERIEKKISVNRQIEVENQNDGGVFSDLTDS